MLRLPSIPPDRWRPIGFAALCSVLLLYELWAVFLKEYGVPRNLEPERRYLVGASGGGAAISQTMRLDADGFSRVTFPVAPFEGPGEGEVVFELREVVEDAVERPLYRVARPVAEVATGSGIAFDFPPIEESKTRRYRVQVRMQGDRPGEGIRLWATRLDSYPAGSLWIDDREQWGDLLFETSAAQATSFAQLEGALAGMPAIVRSRWTLAGVFLLYNWALATFLYGLVFAVDEPARAPPDLVGRADEATR